MTTAERETFRPQPRLTPLGRVVRVAGVLALLVGLAATHLFLIRLGLFALALLAAAFPLSHLNLARLSYRAVYPDSIRAREEFGVEFRLRNDRPFFPAFDIEVAEETVGRTVRFPFAAPRAETLRLGLARFNRRGLFTEFPHRLVSRFPLGLISRERSGATVARVVVYPAPRLPPDVIEALQQGVGPNGYWHARALDVLGDVKSLREFQPGDHVKLISWPFSARARSLIVKEMEQPGFHLCSVVFHSYQPSHTILTRRSFENALQRLAGLFAFFHDNAIPFRFLAPFHDWREIPVFPDPISRRQALAGLATARLIRSPEMTDPCRAIEIAARHSDALLVVSNTPVRFWASLLPPIRRPIVCMDNRSVTVLTPLGVRS